LSASSPQAEERVGSLLESRFGGHARQDACLEEDAERRARAAEFASRARVLEVAPSPLSPPRLELRTNPPPGLLGVCIHSVLVLNRVCPRRAAQEELATIKERHATLLTDTPRDAETLPATQYLDRAIADARAVFALRAMTGMEARRLRGRGPPPPHLVLSGHAASLTPY
jgi:hypothetical protein